VDEQQKVRTITALALAALAEAATPYGIESFDSVLKPLWKGIRQHRGKVSVIFGTFPVPRFTSGYTTSMIWTLPINDYFKSNKTLERALSRWGYSDTLVRWYYNHMAN
jgi:hypothetical protein